MRRNPRKTRWTVLYRRKHKKGTVEEVNKKRTRKTVKFQRAIQGATLEAILQKRNQKPEVRKAQREQAIRWVGIIQSVLVGRLLCLGVSISLVINSCNSSCIIKKVSVLARVIASDGLFCQVLKNCDTCISRTPRVTDYRLVRKDQAPDRSSVLTTYMSIRLPMHICCNA